MHDTDHGPDHGADPRTVDPRNVAILERRINAYAKRPGPRVGDFIRWADGHVNRVSYLWDDEIQTGQGSFYLGESFDGAVYVSMSGGLDPGVPFGLFRSTTEVMLGRVWFFDRDVSGGGRGVEFCVPFRVYECSERSYRSKLAAMGIRS